MICVSVGLKIQYADPLILDSCVTLTHQRAPVPLIVRIGQPLLNMKILVNVVLPTVTVRLDFIVILILVVSQADVWLQMEPFRTLNNVYVTQRYVKKNNIV